jgi:hypothetical protein
VSWVLPDGLPLELVHPRKQQRLQFELALLHSACIDSHGGRGDCADEQRRERQNGDPWQRRGVVQVLEQRTSRIESRLKPGQRRRLVGNSAERHRSTGLALPRQRYEWLCGSSYPRAGSTTSSGYRRR